MSEEERLQSKFVWKDGDRLAVLRPEDPALSIGEAKRIRADMDAGRLSQDEANRQFNEILHKQPFTYLGMLGPKTDILDNDGNVVGRCEPGDSFVPLTELLAANAEKKEG